MGMPNASPAPKFTKVQRGWYATADGCFAVIVDGFKPVSQADRDSDGVLAGITGNEWAAVHDAAGRLRTSHNAGDNLDWFDTKRAAVAFLQRKAQS